MLVDPQSNADNEYITSRSTKQKGKHCIQVQQATTQKTNNYPRKEQKFQHNCPGNQKSTKNSKA